MMQWDDRLVRKEYRKALIPIMISVLGGTINTLIDSAFVSQSIGSEAMAAITLCMPIYLTLCVVGVLFSSGASTLAAQEIGKNRTEVARKLYNSSLAWYLVLGVAITVIFTPLIGPISHIIAQGGELRAYVYEYGFVTVLGTLPTILVYQPIRFLQLEGKSRSISRLMILMLVTDVGLDYLFLFVWNFGLKGAAWATVISTSVACVYGFFALQRGHNFKLQIKKIRFFRSGDIFMYGSPSAVGNLVDAFKMIVLNSVILSNLGPSGTAVWAVLNCLSEISLTVSTGVPQTAAPMIGVYFPSRENSAIRSLMMRQIIWGLSILLVFGLAITAGHPLVERIFAIQESILVPLICLAEFMLLDLMAGIWFRYLNAIGRVALSNTINIMRKMGFPVILTYINVFRGASIWYFLPASGLATIILTLVLLWIAKRKALKKDGKKLSPLLLLNDELEETKRVLDFSIDPTPEAACEAAEKISEFCELHGMNAKLLMRLSLSIEEMLVVMIKKIKTKNSVDLRAFLTDSETGIQIRYVGEYYDPFEEAEKEEDDDLMGVLMMQKLATMSNHYYALGINTVHLFFER